jgi:PAS domain-containing protein
MNDSSELRAKAEKLYKDLHLTKQLSPDETAHLIHELGVHQIELEMQNEQLRKAQLELEKSRQEYAELFDDAPMSYFVFSRKGIIEKINLIAARTLDAQRDRIEGKPFVAFLTEFGSEGFFKHLEDVAKAKVLQVCVVELKSRHSTGTWVKLMTVPKMDESGQVVNFCSAVVELIDLTKFSKD